MQPSRLGKIWNGFFDPVLMNAESHAAKWITSETIRCGRDSLMRDMWLFQGKIFDIDLDP
jgi:hypothetical protein